MNSASESLILRTADLDALAEQLATIVVERLGATVAPERRLRDRHQMAELIGVSLPTLDRLVSAEDIPSLTIGNRRLFDPDAVIEALTRRASQ